MAAQILIETKEIIYAFAITKDGEVAYFFKKKPTKITKKWHTELNQWLVNIALLAKNKNIDEINQEQFWNQWKILDGYAINKKYPDIHFRIGKTSWKKIF